MNHLITVGVITLVGAQLLFLAHAQAQGPRIDPQYTLVKETRVTRTEYDFTFQAKLVNGDAAIKNVRASVSSHSAHTSIVDGTVVFDDLPAGGIATGLDTFTLRQDRRFPLEPTALVWDIKFDSGTASGNPDPQVLQALQTLKQKVGQDIKVEWSQDGRSIVSISTPEWTESQTRKVPSLSSPDELIGTPLENTMAFLKNNSGLFHLNADLGDLRLERSRGAGLGDYDITFEQTVNGVPVFDRGIGIAYQGADDRFTLKGVIRVNSSYIPNLDISTQPRLSENEIIAIAQNDTLTNPLRRPSGVIPKPPFFTTRPKLFLGIYINALNQPVLVYQFTLDVNDGGVHTWYLIDAHDGTILSSHDPAVHDGYVNGTGRVFDPNPVNTLNNTSLIDSYDGVENSRQAVPIDGITGIPYFTKPLLGIWESLAPKQYFLHGRYVLIDDRLENPKLFGFLPNFGVVTSSTTRFSFTRENSSFEHVMAYYVIDTSQRYIQSLGMPRPINARPIKVDPHGYSGEDLSAYLPSKDPKLKGQGYLTFGQGGVDDAEDADIILHEYAHAIQDNQAPGLYMSAFWDSCYFEAGAMAEGFADYWAVSNTYEISKANGFSQGPECFGEWDQAGNAKRLEPRLDGTVDEFCRRRVDGGKIYPKDYIISLPGQPACHENGEIWSATLWDLFTLLGKTTTDQLILQSHEQIRDVFKTKPVFSQPYLRDGGLALLAADEVLFKKGIVASSHKTEICSTLKARGILLNC